MDEERQVVQDENQARPQGSTEVSIFSQDSGGDFPVLKAFQQYLDAEQAKARKRMFNLSIFFVVLLVIVVVAFALIMTTVINRDQINLANYTARNQALSDKLLDIALRERMSPTVSPQPVVVQQPAPTQDAALRPIMEQLSSLQAQISAQRQQMVQPPVLVAPATQTQTAPTIPNAVSTTPPASAPTAESLEILRLKEKIQKQEEALRAEREKAKQDQEKLRQEQIEAHRRRLYPEYYAQQDALKKQSPTVVTQQVIKIVHQTADPTTPPVRPNLPSSSSPVAKPITTTNAEVQKPASPLPVKSTSSAKPIAKAPVRKTEPVGKSQSTHIDLNKDKPISYFERNDDELKRMAEEAKSKVRAPKQSPSITEKSAIPAGDSKKAQQKTSPKPVVPAAKPVAPPPSNPKPVAGSAKPAAPTPPKPAPVAAKPVVPPPSKSVAIAEVVKPVKPQQPQPRQNEVKNVTSPSSGQTNSPSVSSSSKVETLTISPSTGGDGIPWLVELPEDK